MRLELLLNGFKEEQIQVLAPAVPLAVESAPAAEPPHGVLFVGQMVRGKGPDLLLRALALLDPTVKLTMVGEGNWLPHLKDLARKLGLAERITWKHRVSPHQLEALYRGAAVVAVPSRWAEPFGMVGLEAMQHARPVVAFAVGGIPDWLQDGVNGRLIRPPSIADFAGALRQILEDPRLAEAMGRRGLELARSRFSFAQYVARLESVLQPEPAKVAV
jgi:glycosyltransferase involved in cell wall biosynthesis